MDKIVCSTDADGLVLHGRCLLMFSRHTVKVRWMGPLLHDSVTADFYKQKEYVVS